jgi:uncharacterized protein (TIGR02145 family)
MVKILKMLKILKGFRHIVKRKHGISRKSLAGLLLLLIVVGVGFFFFHNIKKAAAEWFDQNWFYRKSIILSRASGAVTNYQMKLTVNYGSGTDSSSTVNCDFRCNIDFSDLIFTASDGTTLLDYWVESYTASSVATVWVEFDSIGTGATTFYMYYGNNSAASASNGANTFLFFDDFSSLNTGVWNNNKNTPTVSDGVLSLDYDDGISESGSSWGYNVRLRQKVKQNLTTAGRFRTGFSDALLPTVPWNNDAAYLLFDETDQHLWGFNINKPGSDDGGSIYQFSADTWYVNDIKRISGSVTYDINGVSAVTLNTNPPTANLYISSHNGTSGGIDYMDWIFVGNYVTPEPTWGAWGPSEQSTAPVAYWKFDEGQGQTAYDESSNNNDGILGATTGSDATDPTWQTEDMCVTGKCLKFDGTNDYVAASDSSSLSPTSAVTVQTWIKSSTGASGIGVITKGPVTSDYDYMLYLSNSGMEVDFYMKNSVGTSDTAGSVVFNWADGLWHHYSAVFDGDWIYVYIDGILRGSNNTALTDIRNSTNPLLIGKGWANELNGFIDDVKIYPYARSGDQIKADYNAGKSGAGGTAKSASFGNKTQDWMSNGLVGYWKMDEATGSGSILADASGNGNDATAKLYGGGNTATDSAHLAGKYGNGFSFDGGDDYINVGTSDTLNPTSAYSISMWAKLNTVSPQYQVMIARNSGSNQGYEVVANYAKAYVRLNSSTTFVTTNDFFTADQWVFVTYTFSDNEDKVRVYQNGSLFQEWSTTEQAYNASGMTTAIGRWGGGNNYYTKGFIDEVRMYNRALSAKEVSDLYNWAPGPVGWWKMDDGVSGNSKTLIDSSGYGNNATAYYGANIAGMNCKVIGRYGGGCLFDGIDDYAEAAHSTSLNLVYGVTMEAWVRLKNAADSGRDDMQFIFNKTNNVAFRDGYDMYFSDSTQELVFEILNHGTWIGQSTNKTDWQPNVWYHIAGTYEYQPIGTNNLKIYVNGVLDAQYSYSNATIGTNSVNATIGNAFGSSNYYNTAGDIDDLRIYNYPRTQKQIMEDMNAGHPSVGSPIGSYAGYWKFDEGYGTTAYDNSINHNDGVITGGVWNNNGKFGKALNFNGTSTYVNAGTGASVNNLNAATWSAWVKLTNQNQGFYFYKSDNDAAAGWFLGIRTGYGIGMDVVWSGSSDVRKYTTTIPPANTWFHIAATWNGGSTSDSVLVYINGKEITYTTSDNGNGSHGDDSALPLYMGYGGSTTPGGYFNGVMDEAKIYPFVLTADEIKTEYNQGKAIVMGAVSDTSGLAGGSVASNSASAAYCVPGDTSPCNPPIAEWNMNENVKSNGKTIYDISGNGNNGTTNWGANVSGMDCTVLGKYATGCKFDGVDDYIDVGNSSSYNMAATNHTMEVWIKAPNYSKAGTDWIFGRFVGGAPGAGYILYNYTTDGHLYYEERSDATKLQMDLPLTSILDNNWHQLVVVVNTGTKIGSIYVDGTIVPGATSSYTGNLLNQNANLNIGGNGTIGNTFPGSIDEMRIFNYIRTPAQIAWDYNRGKPVGYWKFDECQGATAYDASGNGNNGTVTIGTTAPQTTLGTCLTPTDGTGAWYNGKTGKYNSAMSFDGVDDYVGAGNNANLQITGAITLAGWVKLNINTGVSYQLFGKGRGMGTSGVDDGYAVSWFGTTQQLIWDTYSTTTRDALSGAPTITDSNWHYISATWDGTTNANGKKIYVDGKLALQGTSAISLIKNSAYPFVIGATSDAYNRPTSGLIDDVKIYNYALTSSQIKLDYNQGAAVRFAAAWRCGDEVTFTYKGGKVTYGTVSHNNECWMDRNLGASQVATAYNDSNAYGDLFQWGRRDDSHQTRTSGTTVTQSGSDNPGHSNFIYGSSAFDWRLTQNNNLWQGVSGTNNPCPSGWRIPTSTELDTERASWSSQDYNGAFASPLKFTAAGYRLYDDASIGSGLGHYWSSSVDIGPYAFDLYLSSGGAGSGAYPRANGFSVRCIKD